MARDRSWGGMRIKKGSTDILFSAPDLSVVIRSRDPGDGIRFHEIRSSCQSRNVRDFI